MTMAPLAIPAFRQFDKPKDAVPDEQVSRAGLVTALTRLLDQRGTNLTGLA